MSSGRRQPGALARNTRHCQEWLEPGLYHQDLILRIGPSAGQEMRNGAGRIPRSRRFVSDLPRGSRFGGTRMAKKAVPAAALIDSPATASVVTGMPGVTPSVLE